MRLRLALIAAGAAWLLVGPAVVRADTVLLKDGRVITGRVVERGETIFIEQPLGGISVLRSDVLRIESEPGVESSAQRDYDILLLKDGRMVKGDVRVSADGGEIVVGLGARGEVRHPRAAAAMIHWRDGRKELAEEGEESSQALRAKINRLVDQLGQVDGKGQPDHGARGSARRELLALGLFARGHLEALVGERGERAREILDALDELERLRRVLPSRLEEKIPRLGERLIARDEVERENAVREILAEAPDQAGPLLLYLVKGDHSPRLRAFCVSQLSSLRCFEELAEVLKLPDGPLRLAAAFALGDAGIYAGVPILIEALRLDDVQIRQAASHKLRDYTKQHFGYRAEAPPADREGPIAKWETWWRENGSDVVRRSLKQVAPTMAGAKITEDEAADATKLWASAAGMIGQVRRDDADAQLKVEGGQPARTPDQLKERRTRLARSARMLQDALALDPRLSSARMTLAVLLYEELGRLGDARKELLRIIDRAEHDPGDPEAARKFANYHLGRLALRERSWQQATVRFSQALQFDPEYLDAMLGQGDAYMALAFSDDAQGESLPPQKRRETLELALAAFSNGMELLEKRGKRLVELVKELREGTHKTVEESQVIQSVRRSRKELEKNKAALHFRLGRLEAARQADDAALAHYRLAARLDGKNGEYQEAVRFWEEMLGVKAPEPREPKPPELPRPEEGPPPEGGAEQ